MAVAGGVLFSCTGGSVVPRVSPTSTAAMRLDTRWPIKRVIYLMLENRSFDNLFGRFPGVEGTTVGNMLGKEKPLLRCPDWLPGDLGHDRGSALAEYNDGKLDNFGINLYGDPWAYTQFSGRRSPRTGTGPRSTRCSDHFFSSVMGPSFPNHFYFIAGQSADVYDNPENIGTQPFAATEGQPGGGHFKSWGATPCRSTTRGSTSSRPTGGGTRQAQHVLPHADGRRAAHDQGIDWRYYAPCPDTWVLLEPVQRRGRGVPHRPVERARATQHRRSDR